MIIDFSRKCNTYKAATKEELKGFGCPKCHAQGLKNHGTYDRWAVRLETDGFGRITVKAIPLTISRGKCDSCESTHAILPGDIVPYKQYSQGAIVAVLEFVLTDKLTVACAAGMLGIAQQVVYGIIQQWKAMLLKMVLLLRDKFHRYTITGSGHGDETAVLEFVSQNMDKAPQAYLRYYKWPMFMTFSQNTIPPKVFIGISE